MHVWLQAGAIGGILSAADYAPELCVRPLDEYRQNIEAEPSRLDMELRLSGTRISGAYGVSGVKYSATVEGFQAGVARNPCAPLSDSDKEQIVKALEYLCANTTRT